jgi:4-hydroxybenzoate polyprenyltransferase
LCGCKWSHYKILESYGEELSQILKKANTILKLIIVYYFNIAYNVTSFHGKKLVVLSTSTLLGAGIFFGYSLVFGAILCFILLIFVFFYYLKYRYKKYDINDLKWD